MIGLKCIAKEYATVSEINSQKLKLAKDLTDLVSIDIQWVPQSGRDG